MGFDKGLPSHVGKGQFNGGVDLSEIKSMIYLANVLIAKA